MGKKAGGAIGAFLGFLAGGPVGAIIVGLTGAAVGECMEKDEKEVTTSSSSIDWDALNKFKSTENFSDNIDWSTINRISFKEDSMIRHLEKFKQDTIDYPSFSMDEALKDSLLENFKKSQTENNDYLKFLNSGNTIESVSSKSTDSVVSSRDFYKNLHLTDPEPKYHPPSEPQKLFSLYPDLSERAATMDAITGRVTPDSDDGLFPRPRGYHEIDVTMQYQPYSNSHLIRRMDGSIVGEAYNYP